MSNDVAELFLDDIETRSSSEVKIEELEQKLEVAQKKVAGRVSNHPIVRRIKKHLRRIHLEWCNSIKDPAVKMAAMKGTSICGGAIPSLFVGETPKDYDIYCIDNDTQKILFKYYLDLARAYSDQDLQKVVSLRPPNPWEQSSNVGYTINFGNENDRYGDNCPHNIFLNSGDEPFMPNLITYNAITLNNNIQLISRYRGSIEKICKTFDFCHCMCGYMPETDDFFMPETAMLSISARQLLYKGNNYPIYSLLRAKKFLERGWKLSASELFKIAFDISKSKLSNIENLQRQLRGFYGGKYRYIIDILKSDDQYNKKVDFKDLCDILDMDGGEEFAALKQTFSG